MGPVRRRAAAPIQVVRTFGALGIVRVVCRRVTCSTCDKPTWAGCGSHVEAVLGDVAVADRCQCDRSGSGGGGGLLSRLLGRS